MAFIKIITLDGGDKSACSEYFFKSGRIHEKCSITIGEVAEVPDEELAFHLSTRKVMQVPGPEAAEVRKRGRPAKLSEEAESIYALQR